LKKSKKPSKLIYQKM